MDLHDKQFDSWIKDSLNIEIALSKHNRQTAWDQIRLKDSQSSFTFEVEDDFIHITKPLSNQESFYGRIMRWINYVVTHENSYHKAHASSMHYYKGKPNYYGGLTLHRLDLVRYRWICPV